MADLPRRVFAEGFGAAALSATVIGSGIMAERLTDIAALALLCNSVATAAMLVVLCTMLGPISGAHLNPVVTLAFALRRQLPLPDAVLYGIAQFGGALVGALLAHAMFDESLLQLSPTRRASGGLWIAEAAAAFGLVALVLAGTERRLAMLPTLVGLYIGAAYWFTASTSFANPALTLARGFTDSFAGISLTDVPMFVVAQVVGALVGAMLLQRRART